MSEKQIEACLSCGGDLVPDAQGIPTCRFCGKKYRTGVGGFSEELKAVSRRRQLREFSKAQELCEELQKTQPDNCEVYWQQWLIYWGIVYVRDNRENTVKPTFNCYSYDENDASAQALYEKAVSLATGSDREYYQEQAKKLNTLIKEFFSLMDNEGSYDVFISFKSSREVSENGKTELVATEDLKRGEILYQYLTATGAYSGREGEKYKVFFSPVSLGKDPGLLGEKYEPRIAKALQTSQAMILLGSKAEYLQADWVQSEWKRFQYFIERGYKSGNKSLILGYKDMMPALPVALKDFQLPMFDWTGANYEARLMNFLSFVKPLSVLGTESFVNKRKRKKEKKKEEFVETELRVYEGDETVSIDLDRQLDNIESDLDSSRKNRAARTLETLKKQYSGEKTNGRILLLDQLVKCKLNRLSEFQQPENMDKIADFGIFAKIIETAPSKEFAYSVLDLLYGYALESKSTANCVKTLNIVLPYKYRDKKRMLTKLLEKSENKLLPEIFDVVLPRLEMSSGGDMAEMLKIAEIALQRSRFDIAVKYANRVLTDCEEGNTRALDIVLLAGNGCKTYEEFFNAARFKDFAFFEDLKNILNYLPSETKRCDQCGGEAVDRGDALVCKYCGAEISRQQGERTRTVTLDDWNGCIRKSCFDCPSQDFIAFYDKFLTFYSPDEQLYRIHDMAKAAKNARRFDLALHYFNFLLNTSFDKTKVYWEMTLCDLSCASEAELFALEEPIENSKYYTLAFGLAEGGFLKHIQNVRKRQLDCYEENVREKARLKRAKRGKRVLVALVVVQQILLWATLDSFVLALVYGGLGGDGNPLVDFWLPPLVDFWLAWCALIVELFSGQTFWLFVVVGVLALVTLIHLIVSVRRFRHTRHIAVMVFTFLIWGAWLVSAIYVLSVILPQLATA